MKGLLRLAALLAVIALIPSTSAAPVDPVTALAPVEVWADGFGDLRGLAIDPDGAVYVADRQAGTVTRIAADRSRVVVASGLDRPVALAFDPAGRLLVTEEHANRVVRIDADGRRTTIASVQGPRWLAVGADGTLYVSARASTLDGSVQPDDESLEPQVIARLAPSGQPAVLLDGFVGLQGLAVHDDALYVATKGRSSASPRGVVYEVTLRTDGTAGAVTPMSSPDRAQRPVSLAVDASGAIFVTTTELGAPADPSQRAVVKLRPGSGNVRFAGGFAGPAGLAFDADGNLLVADAGRVVKLHAPPAAAFGPTPAFTNVSPLEVALTSEPGTAVLVEGDRPVSGTADTQGTLTLAVPLAVNATTTLEARAIGHAGDGLLSRAATTTVVHDSVVPTIDLQSSTTVATANSSVPISARVTDGGSGVVTVTVSIDGRALGATVTPAPPASSVTAAATWDAVSVTAGVHTVSVRATDRAGNVATMSRSIVVAATGPTPGQPDSTLAVAASTPHPSAPDLLRLTLAPASASVLQGGTTSFGITLANSAHAAGLASLNVEGLPSGVTALLVPRQLAPGQTGQIILKGTPGTPTGTTSFNVRASAGGQSSTVSGGLTVLQGGRTALVGRVVDTDRLALGGVAITLDTLTVSTDANGNFLMLNPPTGDQVVLVDGAPANGPAAKYPTIPVSVTIGADRINELTYVPHLHRQHERFTPIHPTQKTIVTDPELPGVKLHLEGGNDIIGWDGQRADKVSIRTVPADRLPVRPLPPGVRATKVYMFYFGKRGGGIPQRPVPFETPNDLGLKPGDKASLLYFDESPRRGEAPNDWRVAGTGTVSADGQTIMSDPGVGIPKFCCGSSLYFVNNQPDPNATTQRGENTLRTDPVDMSTGLFMLSATDLVLPGRLPLALTRSYRSADANIGGFGIGTMMGYDEYLIAPSSTVLTYVYHGNARTDFVQQPDGSYLNTTIPAFRGTTITWGPNATRIMRDKTGASIRFASFAYGIWLPIALTDANGNQITLTRGDTEFNLTGITDATGRPWTVTREYGYAFRVASVTDPLGRTVSYQYDSSGRLTRVTNPAGGTTQYAYDSQHRMTTITDARGITYLTNTYDSNSRVCQQTQADGGVYAMYYITTDIATAPASLQLLNEAAAGGPISQAPCPAMGSLNPVVATVLVDPRGHPTTYQFNGIGALTSVTDALGQTTTYQRDPDSNLILSVTDPLNRVTSFTYDANGNVLTVTDPANSVRTLTHEPTFSRVTSVRDPLNNVTTFGYDSHGNLTSVTDPLNHTPIRRLKCMGGDSSP